MPTIFQDFLYDYRVDGSLSDWLKAKDDDGWELVTYMGKNYANYQDRFICSFVFKKKI